MIIQIGFSHLRTLLYAADPAIFPLLLIEIIQTVEYVLCLVILLTFYY
jgi:hypothetical protein